MITITAEPYLVTFGTVDFGGDETIVFDGYGQPDSGGSVTVQTGAYQATVTVDADSGKVEIP